MKYSISLLFLFFAFFECPAQSRTSSLSVELSKASTDIERYRCLYNAHAEAAKTGAAVSYEGIDTLYIEIPSNAQSIPLTDYTDFCNAVIIVKNNSNNFTLFTMSNGLESYKTDYKSVENRKRVKGKGKFLLVMEDKTPWVKNRKGFNHGHTRKDILFVNKRRVNGEVISSYGTQDSAPSYSIVPVSDSEKVFKNIVFIRDASCTYKTNLVRVENQYNVLIDNVTLKTPESKLYGDAAIGLVNCSKVKLFNTTIDGTYSQVETYGYGISMNNVSDIEIEGVKGDAKWGIFGNNNINNATLRDCDINRFDVHCYGKDIRFEKCKFRKIYNQFSSMYGTISFEDCEFFDCTPVVFESSYNAYTKFDLVFKDCVFYTTPNHCSLIYGGTLNGERTDGRKELEQQEYPNLYIDGLKIMMPSDVKHFYIYNFKRKLVELNRDKVPGLMKMERVEVLPVDQEALLHEGVSVSERLALAGVAGTAVLYSLFRYYKKRISHEDCEA